MSMRTVTKIAFIAAGISIAVKLSELFATLGLLVIEECGIGYIIFKIFDLALPVSLALFFYVLHNNQKK